RMIEKPGVYRIVVSHDLGWKETATRKIPSAEIKSTFVEPSTEEAKRLIEGMKKQPDIMDSRRFFGDHDWADWSTLRHPVYLSPLTEWAVSGSSWAVIGI